MPSPIRDIQQYTNLLRQGEETIPERLQLLKQHQRRVEEHLKESECHLEVITFKIDCYEQLHTQHKTASRGEHLLEPGDE